MVAANRWIIFSNKALKGLIYLPDLREEYERLPSRSVLHAEVRCRETLLLLLCKAEEKTRDKEVLVGDQASRIQSNGAERVLQVGYVEGAGYDGRVLESKVRQRKGRDAGGERPRQSDERNDAMVRVVREVSEPVDVSPRLLTVAIHCSPVNLVQDDTMEIGLMVFDPVVQLLGSALIQSDEKDPTGWTTRRRPVTGTHVCHLGTCDEINGDGLERRHEKDSFDPSEPACNLKRQGLASSRSHGHKDIPIKAWVGDGEDEIGLLRGHKPG